MTLSRRNLTLGAALFLSGCGFRPMYAPRDTAAPDRLPPIRVALIPEREGQLLRDGLRERLGTTSRTLGTTHELAVSLSFQSSEAGTRGDGTNTRARVIGLARFRLLADGSQEPVLSGVSRALDAYNLLDQEFFATQLALEATRRRIVDALANDIARRVSSHFAQVAAPVASR